MQIGSSHLPRAHRPDAKDCKPREKPGLIQATAEKVVGGAFALLSLPGAAVSGSLVGTYNGARIGHSEEHGVTPMSVAKGMAISNWSAGVLRTSVAGFMVGGPIGSMMGACQEAVSGGFSVYMFFKGGSAKEQGRLMHESLTTHIPAGGGSAKGAAKGLVVGAGSAIRAGFINGANEGKGAVSGFYEGLREIGPEAESAKRLSGNVLLKSALATAGTLSAGIAVPAGIVFGLIDGSTNTLTSLKEKPKTELTPLKRKLVAAAATAALGVAAGSFGGPVGMLIGATVGAVVGLLGPASRSGFQDTISASIARARCDDPDLEHPVANRYQDILQNGIVGAASGARAAWDSVVAASGP